MNPALPPEEGQVLTGPQFSEPMRVVTAASNGLGGWKLGLVGTRTQLFRQVSLDDAQLTELTATDSAFRYDADGELLRLGLDAHALGIAWEFDPYFGLSVSRVDPLPHQLEAVYDHLLKPARVRFLLADDAGAGKTIMFGLLLRELLNRADDEIGRAALEVEAGRRGAEGRLKRAELRHDELSSRRARRLEELERQRSLTLQGVERITSVLVLPHPERGAADVKRHRPDPATEMTAMRVVMEHEAAEGRRTEDVSAKNLGYDVTSLDPNSGDLRLIEVKGLAARSGTILLTPNERRVAEDRPDCYWLYVVTDCATTPVLRDPVRNPARKPWVEVKKVRHYYLDVEKLSAAPDQRSDR